MALSFPLRHFSRLRHYRLRTSRFYPYRVASARSLLPGHRQQSRLDYLDGGICTLLLWLCYRKHHHLQQTDVVCLTRQLLPILQPVEASPPEMEDANERGVDERNLRNCTYQLPEM